MTDDRPPGGPGASDPGGPGASDPGGHQAGPAEVLDCRGQRCPLPVIRLAGRLPQLPVGAVMRVLADDPAAANDIPAWCRLRSQQFVGSPTAAAYDVRRTR